MKNIHLIPTDKPSRLIIYSTLLNEFRLLNEPYEDWKHKRHIYITSDEEIKEADWKYNELGIVSISKTTKENIDGIKRDKEKGYTNHLYKIILTTDTDLIKDGVQAIDDEFLEWFVKNPSCEEVKVENIPNNNWGFDLEEPMNLGYKIIIPKEEPKQQVCNYCGKTLREQMKGCGEITCYRQFLSKQEILEEAAERLYPTTIDSFTDNGFDLSEREKLIFINGAKWQQERYSKMNIIDITCATIDYEMRKYAIEQFKKK